MRGMWSWLTLFWWAATGYRGPMLRAALGVWLGVSLTVLLATLGQAVGTSLTPLLQGGGAQLRVQPSSVHLGPIDLMGTLLKPRRFAHSDVDALRKLPGVASAWPELWSRFPVGLKGSLLGQGLYSDGALLGLPAEALHTTESQATPTTLPPFDWTPPQAGETPAPVPVYVPRSLFAVYNGSFAAANGFPKLKERIIVGLRFQIVAGRSSFGQSGRPPVVLEGEIAGLTSYGDALAAIVPLSTVEWLEEQLAAPDAGSLSSARVTVAVEADPAVVREAIRAQGWAAEEVSGAVRQLALALRVAILAGMGAGLSLIVVALLLMSQVHRLLLQQRNADLQALLSVGVTRKALRWGIALEVMGVTAGVCAVSIGMGYLGAWGVLPWVQSRLEHTTGLELVLSARLPTDFLMLLMPGAPLLAWLLSASAVKRV